ncbi:uncharacterized protein LOC133906041 [Phragmites australis]|uniref:uncharacterized protein LOC133906041 n=1 Tax=Phragmites australis TaxID=29695 RepID=UPI002D780132|nr:uncharacterized protein LOC133906041 [Phragmites australis]
MPFVIFAPLLLLPFGPDSDNVTFYNVLEKKVFSLPLLDVCRKVLCGSSCGWLTLMDEFASVMLLNPFTIACIELPLVDEHVVMASSLVHVSRVDSRWLLHPNSHGIADTASAIMLDLMRQVFFNKIVLSRSPDSNDRMCVAMAMLARSTEVAFYQVGVNSVWKLFDTCLECFVVFVVHYKDMFLAIDSTREIFICSSIAASATLIAKPMPSLSPPTLKVSHKTRRFIYRILIYKCNLLDPRPKWRRVNDVSDWTLFVSEHFIDSFSGTSIFKYKRNKIYFSEPLYGDEYDLSYRLETIDIATDTSKVTALHQKLQGSQAQGWFLPNQWQRGATEAEALLSATFVTI